MTFQILESYVAGKKGVPELCEDIIFTSEAYIAIIDGSSIGAPIHGKPSGRVAADLVASALGACPADAKMEEAVRHINKVFREGIGYKDSAEVMAKGSRPAACCAILSISHDEIWAIGDTLLQIDGKEFDLSKTIDQATTLSRCAGVAALLGEGVSAERILAEGLDDIFVRPLLEKQLASFMNRSDQHDFGYGNIDGADDVLPFVKVISLQGAQEIIMASDGYVKLAPTLAESERILAETLKVEPTLHSLSMQVKGLKPGQVSFDDRAYLRLKRS